MNKHLTDEQVTQFREQGYVKGLRVLDDQKVAQTQSKFLQFTDQLAAKNLTHNDVNGWWAWNSFYWSICQTPAVLDYLESLLGPDLLIWGGQYFAKQPGDCKTVPWHQDAQYWPLTPSDHCVTAWIAVYDTDTTNGCMQVIPGTQNKLLKHAGEQSDTDVLDLVLSADEINPDDAIDIDLKAGEMSLHTDALVHGSGANNSDRLRCGMTMRVSSPDVKADLEKWPFFHWIQLRGSDPYNKNPKTTPPTQEDIPTGYNQFRTVIAG